MSVLVAGALVASVLAAGISAVHVLVASALVVGIPVMIALIVVHASHRTRAGRRSDGRHCAGRYTHDSVSAPANRQNRRIPRLVGSERCASTPFHGYSSIR
jgi:hypothetical protein